MKNKKGILIVLILAAVMMGLGYHFTYSIKLNVDTLPKHIQNFYNRGRGAARSPEVTLFDNVGIGNKEYYLLEIGENLDFGRVVLEKGLNGRYKITNLGYGGGNFLDGIVEDGGKKYFLFGGRDSTAQIAKITVLIEGQTYELRVDKGKDHFLLCTEIDSRVEDNHADRENITFYNANGEDITELYDLSGGGI